MWTQDDIALLNRDQPQILKAILASGCATPELLCDTANILEELDTPHVCCFAMLPFPLAVNPLDSFVIATGRNGATATLRFKHFVLGIDANQCIQYRASNIDWDGNNRGIGTQVCGLITLWGRHLFYYRHYFSCLGLNGLENRHLNMSLWDRKRAPVGFGGDTLNSHVYEDELNSAIILAFEFAVKQFIDNYNIAAFYDFHFPDALGGVFTMPAPGRVSYKRKPTSPLKDMLRSHRIDPPISAARLQVALQFGRRQFDRYQSQLLAMQRLAREGEPDLAIVGCVTAIEWFLNSIREKKSPVTTADEKVWMLSISRCLVSPLTVQLSNGLKERLRTVADRRNSLAHGRPTNRKTSASIANDNTITEVVDVGFSLYKEVQMQLKLGLTD